MDALQNSQLNLIASPDTDLATLRRALDRLGAVEEKPDFWTRILADIRFSPVHRRLALYSLFRRHGPGSHCEAFFALLPPSLWPQQRQVRDETISSKVPVARSPGQSIFMLAPELPPGNTSGIYVRLSAEASLKDFLSIVQGKGAAGRNLRILEVGISDDPSH